VYVGHAHDLPPPLSLVLPVFDEVAVIPEIRRRLHAFLEGLGESWEVVFVDDGSVDQSPALLHELAAADSRY
jgi:glycosyltransferase involved in cell wall biosynthesis